MIATDPALEGERCRDSALALLRTHRAILVRRCQRAFLRHLLDFGPSTSDPVRDLVPIPPGIDPRLVGSAVRGLAEQDLIWKVGFGKSCRKQAHCRDLPEWAIADREAAESWLASNPELPEPPAPAEELPLFQADF